MHGGSSNNVSVLFVCLGNICRSPMAEGAFRALALERGLSCDIDSAGTASFHIGSLPDARAITVAAQKGIDIASQSARQIERDDFFNFSHIIAMDRANLEALRARAPRGATAKMAMLLDAVDGRHGEPVADPYYGDMAAFEAAWSVIEMGAQAWTDRLLREAAALRA